MVAIPMWNWGLPQRRALESVQIVKQQPLPLVFPLPAPGESFAVDALATSSRTSWNLWTIRDDCKLPMDFWCEKPPVSVPCDVPLEWQFLTAYRALLAPGSRMPSGCVTLQILLLHILCIVEAGFYKFTPGTGASWLSPNCYPQDRVKSGPLRVSHQQERLAPSILSSLSVDKVLENVTSLWDPWLLGCPLGSSEWTAMEVWALYGQCPYYTWWSLLENCCFLFLIRASLTEEWDPRVSKTRWTWGGH